MSADVTTPPALQPQSVSAPTAKERRYDRQLRLWAAAGQLALEEAHLLFLNSGTGTVGTETLKNLVLPGVGQFTIVDGATVQEEDLGVNFFLEEESLGKSRAAECARLLMELNPDVKGSSVNQSIHSFLNSDQQTNSLSSFALILLCGPISSHDLQILRQKAWVHNVPIVQISCAGFYSKFSLQLPPLFPIVDTHPDPATIQDLRLLAPWPELSSFAASKVHGLEAMSDHDHGHVPYLVLLLHYLEQWKLSHDGNFPSAYKEKSEFREAVRQGARMHTAEGGEENYDEAVGAVLKSLNPATIPSTLKEIFAEPSCQELTAESTDFWVIAQAIAGFVAKHQVLPLPGAIPDMKAQSADYIQLQNLYKNKARADVAEVTGFVRQAEAKLRPKGASPIPQAEIEAFCKGAAHVRLVRGRYRGMDASRNAHIAMQLDDEESLYPLVLAFEAMDAALDPFTNTDECDAKVLLRAADSEESVSAMETYVDESLDKLKAGGAEFDTTAAKIRVMLVLQELQRAGPAELHNIASLTGGIAAQEIIKILTKQYVPVDNTCVFDGVTSKSAVFRL